MLFTKPIEQISYDDVVLFCEQQISEGINLDYKYDFPNNLEKTIAAFANTFGGLVIIGVEDKDSKPKLPANGIKYVRGLQERVIKIILDNIYPPIFPEIQVCPPKNDFTFVIIRIPQSNQTPHAIRHKRESYVRTDDINNPEELATINELEWLRDKRVKSEDFRERMYQEANIRFNNLCKLESNASIPHSEVTLSLCPLYPAKQFLSSDKILELINKNLTGTMSSGTFPEYQFRYNKPIQFGEMQFVNNKDNGDISYTEINNFGLIYYRGDLGTTDISKGDKEYKYISAIDVLRLINKFILFSSKMYSDIGFWGLADFDFKLGKIFNIQFEPSGLSIENSFHYTKPLLYQDLQDSTTRESLIIELCKNLARAFGCVIDDNFLKSHLKDSIKGL